MTIHYRKQGSAFVVFGNTYPFKEQIKALGGRFQGAEKNWRIPASDHALTALHDLCTGAGGGPIGEPDVSPPVPRDTPAADGVTVSELLSDIALTIQSRYAEPVWVLGEIQNVARRASGVFLELAEGQEHGHEGATTTVKAILWRSTEAFLWDKHGDKLNEVLADGLKVRMLCRVTFYRERGQISLAVEDIDPSFTKGALALAREKLLKQLRAKGLDRANAQVPMPAFPLRVGLISARGSRAASDFTHQLTSQGFPGTVTLYPTPMQGEQVPDAVAAAMAACEADGVDVIVITRGGGSQADLRWFDTAEIAYAIAHCPVPVIAAIGHHDDVCVAELIAHEAQKTPTAAAESIRAKLQATMERIHGLASRMASRLDHALRLVEERQYRLIEALPKLAVESLGRKERHLDHLATSLTADTLDRLADADADLMARGQRLFTKADRRLAGEQETLHRLDRLLATKDPSPWLQAGWTQLVGASGTAKSIQDVNIGDTLQARLRDGLLNLEIKEIEKREVRKS